MKKYAAIAGLAPLLIGIAYIRAIFSHQDHGPIPDKVETPISPCLLDDYIKKEAVAARLDSLRRLCADSLEAMRALTGLSSENRRTNDSLESLIDELSQKFDFAEMMARRARSEKDTKFEKLIAGFYHGEMDRLPADLSRYEREVSVNEIRNKALKYFGVSSETFDRFVKEYR